MPATLSLTETQILTALRSFLLAVLPAGIEVVRGQQNRTPEPKGPDFVVMTPIFRERLATNTDSYADGYPNTPGTANALQPVMMTVQLDVHGPASGDNSQVIATLIRDDFAVQQFKASGFDVAPLYASEPRQVPFINGEQQIETRWIVDAVLQANPVVTTGQDFAGTVDVGLVNVDATYAP